MMGDARDLSMLAAKTKVTMRVALAVSLPAWSWSLLLFFWLNMFKITVLIFTNRKKM